MKPTARHALTIACLLLAGCVGGVAQVRTSSNVGCTDAAWANNTTVVNISVVAKDGRIVPFEILYPAQRGDYPLVLFSHGAFSSPDRYHALLKPIAGVGYIVVAPQHLDSDKWRRDTPLDQHAVWTSRGEDMMLGLSIPSEIRDVLANHGIRANKEKVAVMGHSYGGLIAQLSGGAKTLMPSSLQTSPSVKAVVAFSPPGAMPGLIEPIGWGSMVVPSLTITGTADILPGFIANWKDHTQSFEFAPPGQRWLWVGDGIDHYFGGMIGREKPAPEASRMLFRRAVATTISFLDRRLKNALKCKLGKPVAGEILKKDNGE